MNRISWSGLLAAVLALAACGGGSGDSAPPSAPKAVAAHGTITSFGSIYVNGVRYDTSGTEFEIDDQGGRSQNELSVGQVVSVSGTEDENGNRHADRVRYDAEVEGPVSAVDLAAGTLVVLEQTIATSPATVFGGGVADLGGIAPGDFVEVSGSRLADGTLSASFVRKEDAQSEIELHGTVSALDAANKKFMIGGQPVDYANAALKPVGLVLADGLFVEVEGTLDAGVLLAGKVSADDDFDEDDAGAEVEIKGIIAEVAADRGSFRIGITTVVVSGTTTFVGGTAADLAAGQVVEAEGVLDAQGRLQASKVKFEREDSNGEIEAAVSAIDTAGRSITVLGVAIGIADGTVFKDDRDDKPTFGFADLTVGDYVEVGFTEAGNVLTASRVERDGSRTESKVKGIADSIDADNSTLVIAGVTVNTADASFRIDEQTVTAEQFYAAAAAGSKIKARGSFDGVTLSATKVELESSDLD